jgi:hypothetical protein
MKRVKVMLMAITVLTVVGGALAFKAAKFNTKYCIKTGASGACTTYFTNSKILDPGGSQFRGFETTNTSDCVNQSCPNIILLEQD